MNVTKDGFKDRQLHMEDYLQMVPAEQGEYAEVSVYQRITENNDTITDFWTDNLLELILRKDNLNKAYKKVKSNKGKGGIDGMEVDELLPYLRENQTELIQQIREGKYKPNPVRRVEIPKEEKGKVRKLRIPMQEHCIKEFLLKRRTVFRREDHLDSPLLSNVLLNELDKELERRGHRFVRFADYTEVETMPKLLKNTKNYLSLQSKLSA